MINLKRQPATSKPPRINENDQMPFGYDFRISLSDLKPYFQSNPLFADRNDAQWFLTRAWNKIPPPVGRFEGQSFISVEKHKYVLLHRYGEGIVFDASGTSNSPGFLSNMETLPIGMSRIDGQYYVDPAELERCPRLPGSWAIFFNGNLQNYYHWLVEGMLALELMKSSGLPVTQTILPMLLPPEGQFDHTDIMQALGYGDIQVIRSSSPYVSCESVMHVEYGEIEHFPARYLRSLQARIASKFHGLSRNNRILVMRKELRSISNISAFVEMLTPLGFRPYFLEDMQFEEQVEIFARAEFIVAPHGAGLSNLIFSPPECRVIELSPDCEMRPFFWEISCKLGHIYGMLPCATHDGGFNGRLMVDLEKFRVLYTLVEKQW